VSLNPGLCLTCQYSRQIQARRTVFWFCERSQREPTFPRYPRLPVTRCSGYEMDQDKQHEAGVC